MQPGVGILLRPQLHLEFACATGAPGVRRATTREGSSTDAIRNIHPPVGRLMRNRRW